MSVQNTVNSNSLFGTANIYLVPKFDLAQLDTEITSKLIEANLLIITDDGTNFDEEKTMHSTPLAGFNEKRVKGFENITKAEGKISATGRLVNKKLLEASLYVKESNSSEKYDVYRVKEGLIEDSAYSDVVMVGMNKSNEKAQIVVLHNAYNTNLSIETKGSDDGSCKVEFVSAYDYANLNKTPYEIITLKEV
ncbi:Uncharacterised protein [uncultured Clostridium sp.]|uniref:hypothetical protein n=1 Tax=uncultured Clostridium sp. TaxID=59620 RepID=UPI000822E6DE|nr:hypothetical protein [uncultured Clostridium sp.]SCJ00062.1 Uncharacterised protein [uncultured Clostridium sp.]